jgi:hypothetical protein
MNYIAEIVKTFSSKSSFFSSKRLERFAIVAVALSANIVYLYFHVKTMSAIDFLLLNAALFTYAGFNTKQIQKDEKTNNPSTDNNSI